MPFKKPHLSFWQIINMNFGLFSLLQYSFGLLQANMSPIYSCPGVVVMYLLTGLSWCS